MSETEHPPCYKRPIFWGWLGTVVVALIGFTAALSKACGATDVALAECPTKWTYLMTAAPNELGDTLAGFAGALAFIWIIVTVAMQSLELAAQRQELSLTRKELKRTADAQHAQVRVFSAQALIFEDEQKQRNEIRASELLDRKFERLRILSERAYFAAYKSEIEALAKVSVGMLVSDPEHEMSTNLYNLCVAMLEDTTKDRMTNYTARGSYSGTLLNQMLHIRSLVTDILEMQYDLSPGEMERLFNFEIDRLDSSLGRVEDYYQIHALGLLMEDSLDT